MYDHSPIVCFIVCDNGPAVHFLQFARDLLDDNHLRIDIYANESVLSIFQDLQSCDGIRLFHFSLDQQNTEEKQDKLANELIDNCVVSGARTIIVDIANEFDRKLQNVFNQRDMRSHPIRFWCYYDNSEAYVPGGYSIQAEEMIKLSQNILFANMNLVQCNISINLDGKNVQGIGYYPIGTAEILRRRRVIERETLRTRYGWNSIEYIFIYWGGNNKTYYEQAFPAFLSLLSQIDVKSVENILFIIHQHPAAKKRNQDGLFFREWLSKNAHIQAILSPLTSDEAQILADAILYYQTSAAPQFALLGLPTMQIGHEVYEDVLVKYHLCETATNSDQLIDGLKVMKEKSNLTEQTHQIQLIHDAIGYTSNWLENLRKVIS